ncbi:hypothetical protein, partial [Streptomyces mirabilis]|uniref:hypothetical protein n=1 Tax=Streptomyces mirabilis TaxID=68239 RepID=UPI002E1FEF62
LWEFLAEFLAPEFAWRRILCGLCRAAGAALVLRVNLPGGKFWVCGWSFGLCILPGGKILVWFLLGRWRGLLLGF